MDAFNYVSDMVHHRVDSPSGLSGLSAYIYSIVSFPVFVVLLLCTLVPFIIHRYYASRSEEVGFREQHKYIEVLDTAHRPAVE